MPSSEAPCMPATRQAPQVVLRESPTGEIYLQLTVDLHSPDHDVLEKTKLRWTSMMGTRITFNAPLPTKGQ